MQVRFNINDEIKVKLTKDGEEIMQERYEELKDFVGDSLGEYVPKEKDEDGYVKFQMWKFMQIFGDRIYLSGELPFDTEIRLEGN